MQNGLDAGYQLFDVKYTVCSSQLPVRRYTYIEQLPFLWTLANCPLPTADYSLPHQLPLLKKEVLYKLICQAREKFIHEYGPLSIESQHKCSFSFFDSV
jgi:hypothetical protein